MIKHLRLILRNDSSATPWERMFACGFATGFPLAIGVFTGHAVLSIFGSLTGYLLALNDHFGAFRHRLLVLSLSFALLAAFFSFGYLLQSPQSPPLLYQALVVAAVYWLGLFGGRGAELERGLMFAVLCLIVSHGLPPLPPNAVYFLAAFGGIGYAGLIAFIAALEVLRPAPPAAFESLGQSWRKSLTSNLEMHAHAASYSLSALAAIWTGSLMHFERGYWITITVLLIMKPDRKQTLYKTMQRLIGTMLAVLLANPLLSYLNDVSVYALLGTAAGFAVPWAARRNYIWVSFFATVLVICLLEIVSEAHADRHLPLLRLQATAIGCAISALGASLSKTLEIGARFLLPKKAGPG